VGCRSEGAGEVAWRRTAYWASVPRKAARSRVPSESRTRAVRAITKSVVRWSIRAPSWYSSGAMKRLEPNILPMLLR
jgi:hypothetical protein